MAQKADRAFHVACPYTGLAVCHCTLGYPSRLSKKSASQQYFRQAKRLWEIWQNSHNLFDKPNGVDVLIPVLYKREIVPYDDVEDEKGLPTQEEAEKNIGAAEKLAKEAAVRAVRLAAGVGIPYTPPEGVDVDLGSIRKPHKVEASVDDLQKEISVTESEIKNLDDRKRALKTGGEEQEAKEKLKKAQQKYLDTQAAKKQRIERSGGQMLQPMDAQGSGGFEQLPVTSRPRQAKHRMGRKLLTPSDMLKNLVGQKLEVFWPEDKSWWSVTVQDMHAQSATLLYSTSEIEQVDLVELVRNGEVGWPSGSRH